MRASRIRRLWLITAFAASCLMPLLILMMIGSTDPFLHTQVATTIRYQDEGGITFDQSNDNLLTNAPLFYFTVISISDVAGISLDTLQYLPIAGMLISIAFLSLARRFMKTGPAAIATIAVLWTFVPPNNYSIWPHAFGIALFAMFLSIYARYLSHQTKELGVVLIVLIVAVDFQSYTAGLWIISVMVFVNILTLPRLINRMRFLTLLLMTSILFLSFSQVLYGSYLPTISTTMGDLGSIFNLENLLGLTRTESASPYYPSSPSLAFQIISYARFTLYLAPIALVVLGMLMSRRLRESLFLGTPHMQLVLIFALLLTIVPDALVYSLAGAPLKSAILRFFFFVSPIASLMCVAIIASRRSTIPRIGEGLRVQRPLSVSIKYGVVLVITSATFLLSAIFFGLVPMSETHYENVDSCASWILAHGDTVIVSDMQTSGRIQVVAALLNLNLVKYENISYLDVAAYEYLSGESTASTTFSERSYLFVFNLETSNRKVTGDSWITLRPVQDILADVDQNTFLNKIYDKSSMEAYLSINPVN